MTTRGFDFDFLNDILSEQPPEGVEVVEVVHDCYDDARIVFKLIDDWTFYKLYVQSEGGFGDANTGELFKNSGIIYCQQVEPHIEQVVRYQDI